MFPYMKAALWCILWSERMSANEAMGLQTLGPASDSLSCNYKTIGVFEWLERTIKIITKTPCTIATGVGKFALVLRTRYQDFGQLVLHKVP